MFRKRKIEASASVSGQNPVRLKGFFHRFCLMKMNCATKVVCLRSHLIAFLTLESPADPQLLIQPSSPDLSLGPSFTPCPIYHGHTHTAMRDNKNMINFWQMCDTKEMWHTLDHKMAGMQTKKCTHKKPRCYECFENCNSNFWCQNIERQTHH